MTKSNKKQQTPKPSDNNDLNCSVEIVQHKNTLNDIQQCFKHEIEHIRECAQNIIPNLLDKENKDESDLLSITHKLEEELSKLEKQKKSNKKEKSSQTNKKTQNEIFIQFIQEISKINIKRPSRVLIKSLFLNIFSEFDSFLGLLLRFVFTNKPEVIERSEKQYTAQDIFAIGSIEKFKNEVIEKEIDSIIRKSYIEQFVVFENKFCIDSLRKFENWGKFVEITQRRNIIMHCDGNVTNQFYENCKENNCLPDNITISDKLSISYEYLLIAISIVHEVGIKLLHTVWRKMFPNERENADSALSDYIFKLLADKNYEMAEVFGKFANNMKPQCSNSCKYYFLINYCISLKKLGKQEMVKNLIDIGDWTSVLLEFQLAKCILLDDYTKMKIIMKKIGGKSEVFTKEAYAYFPLFSFVHDNQLFKDSFKSVFKTDFDTIRAKMMKEELNPSIIQVV